jgi:hypothetical protein
MRRSNRRSGRYIRNNGFSLESISGTNTNSSGIWSTHFPPSYENIYNSSMPINPPPDYEAAKKKNLKTTKENNKISQKTEVNPIVSFHSVQNQDGNQSLPVQANDTNLNLNITESHHNQNIKASGKIDDDGVVSIEFKTKNDDHKIDTSEISILN